MPRGLPIEELIRQAARFRDEGADVIDLGCDPGRGGTGVGGCGRGALREDGFRVSIDSFDPVEVAPTRRRPGPSWS